MKHGLILALALLAGCQTMQRHPIATAVVVGIAAGCIAASTNHRTPYAPGPAMCRNNPRSCQ